MKEESIIIRIGPKLREVLNLQKEVIKEFTYNVVTASDYEAGEILADKILKNKLV